MRLLFVHRHLGELGGAEANIHLTAEQLGRRGHMTGLLYGSATGKGEDQWRATFSECFRLPGYRNGTATQRALEYFTPDVLWVHNLSDLEVLEALLQSPKPVIRTVHDHALYCMRSYKYDYFTRQICLRPASTYCIFPCLASVSRNHRGGLPLKWVSYSAKRQEIRLNQHCRRLIVFSDYIRQELLRNGFDGPRIEVHAPLFREGGGGKLGVGSWEEDEARQSCSPLSPNSQPPSSTPLPSSNLIVWAGQIVRGKGLDLFLRALTHVKTNFECAILGDGSHRAYCEKLSKKLGLSGRVKFYGFVGPEQLQEFFCKASLFAFSSVWPEPFGMAGPEAMRHGLPVVAFDAGAVREWLTDGANGFLVPWGNTNLFGVRIEQLLQNRDLAQTMGRCARERVAREFNPDRAIERLDDLLFRVVQETQTAASSQQSENFLNYEQRTVRTIASAPL
ncbi:MAG: glycosyltransferase family 1 protein [Verrucomicrobia bacterium]|nr:MAG: glycosyltransferase family 1 protein [Verrucomicrobiota bacterium]